MDVDQALSVAEKVSRMSPTALAEEAVDLFYPEPGHCYACLNEVGDDWEPYPCPTVRALDGGA